MRATESMLASSRASRVARTPCGAAVAALAPIGLLALMGLLAQVTFAAAVAPHLFVLVTAFLVVRLTHVLEVPMHLPHIVVTEQDSDRLCRLLEALPPKQRAAACALELELERAQVVTSRGVPGDVVTMNSLVVFEEVHSGLRAEVRLVYPSDAVKGADGTLSVLAPVGSALLGLSVGHAIDWRMPSGRLRRYRVVDILYQPEAAGDLHL